MNDEMTITTNELFNALGVFITALGAACQPDFVDQVSASVERRSQAMTASGETRAAKLASALGSALRIGANPLAYLPKRN